MSARRGKSQARRTQPAARRIPGWAWLVSGLVLGLGLALWVMHGDGLLDANKLFPQPDPQATAPRDAEPPIAQRPVQPETRKPKYDFYTVLKEREVQIPDAELAEQASKPELPADTQAADQLFLQAGAFSDPRRAEEIKAAIAFSGLVARVEPTQTAGGQTVHRVMLGPFANSQALDQAKSTLASNGVQAIALRNPAR